MRLLRALRAPLLYTVAALVYTWPLALHPIRSLASVEGPGDAYLNLWIIGWDLHTLATHPAAFFTGAVFNASIFHPAANTLAYSDHFLLQSLVVSPLYFITHNPVLCYNAVFFGSLVAAAWAMHVAVREITGAETGAWVAGLAWGFAPYHFGHFIHIQLQAMYVLPLAFLCLHRTLNAGRRRDVVWLGVMLGALAITSVYYGVIGGFGLTISVLSMLFGQKRDAWFRAIRRLGVAALIGLILVAPFAYPYWRAQRSEGFGRSLAEAAQGSARLRAYVTAPPENLLYGRTVLLRPSTPDNAPKATEQMLFPGFALIGLALFGLWRATRDTSSRRLAITLGTLAVAGVLFSFGPEGVRPLYAAAHRFIFGFQAIRAPSRFSVLVLFALAGLAALALSDVARARPRLAMALAVLVGVEYLNAPIDYAPAPRLETRVDAWLRDTPDRGAVMYQPLAVDARVTTPFMVRSLLHGHRVLNGYSGLRPAFYDSLAQAMTAFPSLETIRSLDHLDVKFVVTASPLDIRGLPLVERARFDDGVVYEVRWTPAADAALDEDVRHTSATPIVPSLPFGPGETASYSIVWETGPLAVSAGRAIFRVQEDGTGARLALSAEGTTADWVSRFFEADDRFVSHVDASLRPSLVEQHLHEGSRRVDRLAEFDRAAGVVRLRQGQGPEVSLPAVSGAFDPISAIYYLRAAAGHSAVLRLPINDWGREVSLSVPPGVIETIRVGDDTVDALRLEPHVWKRDTEPAAYRLTLWLSQDSRRIPLRITVDGLAGVGSVRLELEAFVAGRNP